MRAIVDGYVTDKMLHRRRKLWNSWPKVRNADVATTLRTGSMSKRAVLSGRNDQREMASYERSGELAGSAPFGRYSAVGFPPAPKQPTGQGKN
jgi:hypothetical protein